MFSALFDVITAYRSLPYEWCSITVRQFTFSMRICSYVRFVRVFLFSLAFFRAIFFCLSFRSKAFVFFFSFSILGFQFYDLPNIRRLGFIDDDKWKKKRRNKIKETSTIWNMYKKKTEIKYSHRVFVRCMPHQHLLNIVIIISSSMKLVFAEICLLFFTTFKSFFSIDGFSIFRCLFLFNSS